MGSLRVVAVSASLLVGLVPVSASATPPEPPPEQGITRFCTEAPAYPAAFTDIAATTFEGAIRCLSASRIAEGRTPETFAPSERVSRGQMATFLARLIDGANLLEVGGGVAALPADDGVERFSDTVGTTHAPSIRRLAAAGLVQGGPAGRPADQFGPGLAVQRDQMASFIARTMRLLRGAGPASVDDHFTDDESSVHEANIDAIAAQGIAVGDGVDRYDPTTTVTRGQMAAFLVRSLARLHQDGVVVPLPPPVRVEASTTIPSGGRFIGTLTGGAASATADGCGLVSEPVEDLQADSPGIQFDEVLPSTAQGTCGLTLSFVRLPSGVQERAQVTLLVEGRTTSPNSGTPIPELVSAVVVSTTPADGTTIAFTFDERLVSTAGAERFAGYRADGTRIAASGTPTIDRTDVVFVVLPGVTTEREAAELVLATVDDGAVTDATGATNVEGDAALRGSGRTDGPDLVGVVLSRGPAEPSAPQGPILLTYSFDEDVDLAVPSSLRFATARGASNCPTAENPTAEDVDHTVVCRVGTGSTRTAIVLGSVDRGAVREETDQPAGLVNPEGSELSTGGGFSGPGPQGF